MPDIASSTVPRDGCRSVVRGVGVATAAVGVVLAQALPASAAPAPSSVGLGSRCPTSSTSSKYIGTHPEFVSLTWAQKTVSGGVWTSSYVYRVQLDSVIGRSGQPVKFRLTCGAKSWDTPTYTVYPNSILTIPTHTF